MHITELHNSDNITLCSYTLCRQVTAIIANNTEGQDNCRPTISNSLKDAGFYQKDNWQA